MKLFSEHDNAKAAIELRNAVRLKRDLIGAWKALAEIDETKPQLARRRRGHANHCGAYPERRFGEAEARKASAACRLLG